ncbi:DUF1345 domain-containing protein [Roseateles sp.]|uniref:DUF1345 domain-containing protein n=1 Tax=Roseateles sp. TaxID=1971397 RepID=UPI00286A1A17|nr:DUF1345 domain-containing protein [Roseateles sp.]
MNVLSQLRLRPRLLSAIAVGLLVGLLVGLIPPADIKPLTRCLLGWNVGVWLYLALCLRMMLKADAAHLERTARAQVDGVGAVLLLAVLGALASFAAIAVELAQIRQSMSAAEALPHWLLAIATVAGSWLLLPVEFGLAYASLYHAGSDRPHGLEFPGQFPKPELHPNYVDFMYFAFTIAATSATSDVAVSGRHVRRLVLLHCVLSFMFNAGVMALMINSLSSLIR